VLGVIGNKMNIAPSGAPLRFGNLAVKASEVAELLDGNGVKYETSTFPGNKSAVEVAEQGRNFTFRLTCVHIHVDEKPASPP